MSKNFGSSAFLRWLTLCLLVVLAILLLVVNLVSFTQQSSASPTKTTTSAQPTPTQPPLPKLNPKPIIFTLQVKSKDLLSNSSNARQALKKMVMSRPELQGQQAGFVSVYVGAPDPSQIPTADQVASKVEEVLQQLGNDDNFVFIGTVYDVPFHDLGGDLNMVKFEIYLLTQS